MRVLLFRYGIRKENFGPLDDLAAIEPPIWMLAKRSQLTSAGHQVYMIDNELDGLSREDLARFITDNTIEEVQIWPTGNHPSAYIHQREGVDALLAYIQTLGVRAEIMYKLDFNPTQVSFDWDLVSLQSYRAHNWHCWGGLPRTPYATLFTSIGCPFNCKFCSIKDFYGLRYAPRDIVPIVKDLEAFVRQGVRNIKMMDELFFWDRYGQFEYLCDHIAEYNKGIKGLNIWAYARIDTINKRMLKSASKAGVRWIGLGIESGNEKIRKSVSKGNFTNQEVKDICQMIRDQGMFIGGNFMFGFPEDSLETMQETLDFALDLKCEFTNLYTTMAYPGSQLYDLAQDNQWELPPSWIGYSQYAYECFPLRTRYLDNKQVLKFRDGAFDYFYSDPDYREHMKRQFGQSVLAELDTMIAVKLKRKLLE